MNPNVEEIMKYIDSLRGALAKAEANVAFWKHNSDTWQQAARARSYWTSHDRTKSLPLEPDTGRT